MTSTVQDQGEHHELSVAAGLEAATSDCSMFARGRYDADSNTFTAVKFGVYLLEP
jgi:hypothetical protein